MMAARETASTAIAVPGMLTWRNVIALALSLSFVFFLATSFHPDLGAVRQRVEAGNTVLLFFAVVAHYASLVVRGRRWQIMLRSARPDVPAPSTLTCSLYLLLCWFVNAITWLRLGNLYRAYLVSDDARGGFFPALGTVVTERFLDLLAVLLMLLLAALLLVSTGDSGSVGPFLLATAASVCALGLALLALRRFGGRLVVWLPARARGYFGTFRAAVLTGLSRDQLPVTGSLTLLAWGFESARLWLVVLALGLDISVSMLLFVTFAQAMLLSLPLTPGGLGVVEPGLTGLLLLSFERPDAVTITLLDRSISYVSVVAIGAVAFGLREVLRRTQRETQIVARVTRAS